MSAPTFTIFIPTYNRAHLLPRAFASIERQSNQDFEVVIIDDGSTDNTCEIVESWKQKVDFPVIYHYQVNQGKPAAHNAALEFSRGYFTVILDSDDILADNALELLLSHWNEIPDTEKSGFAGIEGHCAYIDDQQITGNIFPQDVFDSTYLETRYKLKIAGDKKNSMRTDVLRAFPFPQFPGEKSVRESLVWNRIAAQYKMRYINQVIQYIEYQPGGLSTDIFKRRVTNPQGFRLAHQEMINLFNRYCTIGELFKEMSKYIRFSLHAHVTLPKQLSEIRYKPLWFLMLPKGWINYLLDCRKLHRIKKKT